MSEVRPLCQQLSLPNDRPRKAGLEGVPRTATWHGLEKNDEIQ